MSKGGGGRVREAYFTLVYLERKKRKGKGSTIGSGVSMPRGIKPRKKRENSDDLSPKRKQKGKTIERDFDQLIEEGVWEKEKKGEKAPFFYGGRKKGGGTKRNLCVNAFNERKRKAGEGKGKRG